MTGGFEDGWGSRRWRIFLPPMPTEEVDEVCDHLNHIVHGDPVGAEWNVVCLGEDTFGYGLGKSLGDSDLCDWICDQAISWLTMLTGLAANIFPEYATQD